MEPMAAEGVPDGYQSVTPYLMVHGVDALLDFVERAFGAEEIMRMPDPDGTITHAEVRIGDSVVMMGEASERWPAMPTSLHLFVEDSDAAYERARSAGGTSVREPTDEPYGDRMSGVKDPFGNLWWMATRLEP
jgi:PhnB protein